MNKYKDKTLYRLIPIKAIVYLYFFVKSREFFFSLFVFCCFNIKNKNSVIVFYIYTIIYSKLVLHLLNINAILRRWETKKLLVHSDLHIVIII